MENFLENLTNLEELKWNYVFDSIDPNAEYLFRNLTRLKRLDLSYSCVKHLKSAYFEFLVDLEELYLYGTSIKTIEPGTFKKLNKINILDLSSNEIKEFHKSILDVISDLNVLN